MTPIIQAVGLHKSYGDTKAVRDLSFSVEAGTVLGLLGPNGAGKTTTISMLTTLISIDGGSATVGGFDVATQPDAVRGVIGLAGQAAAVDDKLTARENLDLFGRLYKIPKSPRTNRVDELIERFDLTEFADRPASTYSGGERRRVDLVAALVAAPSAIFLDEPTTGLDPRSRRGLWSEITQLASGGAAVVLTTQYLDEADALSDQIVMIDRGTVVAEGTPDQLKKDLEGDVLDVRLQSPDAIDEALAAIGIAVEVSVDRAGALLTIPVGDSASSLEILRRLNDAGTALADFQLRRPTLDDVFLTLTGQEVSS